MPTTEEVFWRKNFSELLKRPIKTGKENKTSINRKKIPAKSKRVHQKNKQHTRNINLRRQNIKHLQVTKEITRV